MRDKQFDDLNVRLPYIFIETRAEKGGCLVWNIMLQADLRCSLDMPISGLVEITSGTAFIYDVKDSYYHWEDDS